MERKKWTREQLLEVLDLYPKLDFGQMHARNPDIIALAQKLGRGENSVAMKLCNFASLDPVLTQKGLSGVSRLDKEVWDEWKKTS
jgi:putative restriction endonuclease